jgi:hypothetical protein
VLWLKIPDCTLQLTSLALALYDNRWKVHVVIFVHISNFKSDYTLRGRVLVIQGQRCILIARKLGRRVQN